jgi:hypothetical protein
MMNIFAATFMHLQIPLRFEFKSNGRIWYELFNLCDHALLMMMAWHNQRVITVVWSWGCYKSPPLQEISSRDLSGEVKCNFGRADPGRVDYLADGSGNVAEVSLELKLRKTSRLKYEGAIRSFKRMDIRSIPEQSMKRGSEHRGWISSRRVARDNTQSQEQRILQNQGCTGGSSSDPVELWWGSIESRENGDILPVSTTKHVRE